MMQTGSRSSGSLRDFSGILIRERHRSSTIPHDAFWPGHRRQSVTLNRNMVSYRSCGVDVCDCATGKEKRQVGQGNGAGALKAKSTEYTLFHSIKLSCLHSYIITTPKKSITRPIA